MSDASEPTEPEAAASGDGSESGDEIGPVGAPSAEPGPEGAGSAEDAPEPAPALPVPDATATHSFPPLELSRPESDEQAPVYGVDDSDEHARPARFTTERLGGAGSAAYDLLEIRTPLEEFEAYARARLEALVRLGQAERAAVAADALQLGLATLRHVMGASPREEEAS